MANHVATAIWIGGEIKRRTAKKLCEAISEQRVSLDWSEALFEPNEPEQLISACRQEQEGHLLFLCDCEARWGEFQLLEDFLVRHHIAFMRQTDGYQSDPPTLIEYRPGLGQVGFPTDSMGEPLVPLAVARGVEKSLKQLLSQKETPPSLQSIHRIWRSLHRQLPPDIPRLTPLRIV